MPRDDFSLEGVEFYGEWKATKKPHRLPRHKNAGLEIVLVSKGELKWEVEGRPVQLQANTLFYTLPWQEHGGIEEMQPSCEISYLCLTLAKSYVRPPHRFGFHQILGFTPVEEGLISSALMKCRVQSFPASSDAAWLFAHFFRIAQESSRLRQARARDTIKLMLAELARLAAMGNKSQSRPVEAERRVRKFLDVLAVRYAEPWTLRSMSEACRLGRTQFSELLKKQPATVLSPA